MISEELIEYAISKGYNEEQEKTAGAMAAPTTAAAGWLDDIWRGLKGAYVSGKGHVKELFKPIDQGGGKVFGPKSWKAYIKNPEANKFLGEIRGMTDNAARKEMTDMFMAEARANIAKNRSALKGLGIVAGGTAAAGMGTAGVVNALTPPKKVTIVQ